MNENACLNIKVRVKVKVFVKLNLFSPLCMRPETYLCCVDCNNIKGSVRVFFV